MPSRTFLRLTLALFGSAFSFVIYGQESTDPLRPIYEYREKQENEMRGGTSPLLKKDKRKFKGLKYYPPDLSYRVKARFVRTENPVLFKMKTTTSRLPSYIKYGEVHFELFGNSYMLEVYQSPDIIKREGYEDYLFIPFTDLTNGTETYEVGRYLEMRIPEGNEVIIDFNLGYNPYCSYNPGYSCPIPPAANHLELEIRAGEKKFKDHH